MGKVYGKDMILGNVASGNVQDRNCMGKAGRAAERNEVYKRKVYVITIISLEISICKISGETNISTKIFTDGKHL